MENINLEKIVFLLDCLSRPKEATYLRMVIEEIGKDPVRERIQHAGTDPQAHGRDHPDPA